jgi:hypothetical protein
MSTCRYEHNCRSIVPLDHALQDQYRIAAAGPPMRLVSVLESNFFMVLVFAAGAIGLTCFASQVSNQDQKLAAANQLSSGINVRSEVLDIWLPAALIELAKSESPTRVIRTHENLMRFLERCGQKNVWYAMTLRLHQADGDFVDIAFIRQPYRQLCLFSEFLVILAVAAGDSPDKPPDEFSTTFVHLLPESLLKRDPRDAIADLLADPAPPLNAENIR